MMCPCGKPLHYHDSDVKAYMEQLVDDFGENITVSVLGGKIYQVPRHYIALHGLKVDELPSLAKIYGFKEL